MIVIGLMGGIGTGKSTVSHLLAEKGAVIIDADKLGHEAYQPHSPIWHEVVAAFGKEILQENQEINRRKLGEIIFSNPESQQRLNSIMHPRMKDMMRERIGALRQDGVKVVVLEAALLVEANWIDLADQVWVTVAPESVVLKRVNSQRGLSPEQIQARIHAQLPSEERAKYAQVVLDTDCELDEVQQKIDTLWQGLKDHS